MLLNEHGTIMLGCREIQWLKHEAYGATNEAGKSKQGPDLIKTLCHPEKFILEVESREMSTPHHNDLRCSWTGLEHSWHVLLIGHLFAVFYYF